MALSLNQKVRLGECLAKLVPGFDGQVLAFKDYEIVWNDTRPLPSEAQIVAAYNQILADEAAAAAKENEKGLALARLKIADLQSATTIAALKVVLADLLKVLT